MDSSSFDYIDIAGKSFGVSQSDIDTTKKVLRAIKLPQAFDAKFNEISEAITVLKSDSS